MDREGAPDHNPRAWARPDREGDPWHEYWEPEGVTDPPLTDPPRNEQRPADPSPDVEERREKGRQIALAFVIFMPGLIIVDVALRDRPGAPLGAFLAATACVIGLLRVRSYGEHTKWLTLTMAAFIIVWVAILVAYAAQVEIDAVNRVVN